MATSRLQIFELMGIEGMSLLQEHICSAAPAVIGDYKETTALNKDLKVRFDSLPISLHATACTLCLCQEGLGRNPAKPQWNHWTL